MQNLALLKINWRFFNRILNNFYELKIFFMKKIILLIITAALISSLYYGCSKTDGGRKSLIDPTSAISDYIFKSAQPTDGNIDFLVMDQEFARFKNGNNNPVPYFLTFSAGFYKNRQRYNWVLLKGNLIIDGKTIINDGKTYGMMQYSLESDTAKWMYGLWGRKIGLNITKPSAGTYGGNDTASYSVLNNVSGDFYLPEPIQLGSIVASDFYLHKSGQTVVWNPDPNNPTKKVVLMIILRGQVNDTITFEKEVDDNGSYTFSSVDLTDLPLNSEAQITIGRGNYTTMNDSSDSTKNVFITALTTSIQPVTVVQ